MHFRTFHSSNFKEEEKSVRTWDPDAGEEEVDVEKVEVCAKELTEKKLEAKGEAG